MHLNFRKLFDRFLPFSTDDLTDDLVALNFPVPIYDRFYKISGPICAALISETLRDMTINI